MTTTLLQRVRALWWAVLAAFILLLIVARLVWLVVALPEGGVAWGPSARWGHLGALLEGIGTLLLAVAAIVGGLLAYRDYRERRRREMEQDLARLEGDAVTALRQRYEYAVARPEEAQVRERLRNALDVYELLLHGLVRLQSERRRLKTAAISAAIEETQEELKRLRRTVGERL